MLQLSEATPVHRNALPVTSVIKGWSKLVGGRLTSRFIWFRGKRASNLVAPQEGSTCTNVTHTSLGASFYTELGTFDLRPLVKPKQHLLTSAQPVARSMPDLTRRLRRRSTSRTAQWAGEKHKRNGAGVVVRRALDRGYGAKDIVHKWRAAMDVC